MYDVTSRLDAQRQSDDFRLEAADAVDEGCTGTRVTADITALAMNETTFANLVEYELCVDQMMTANPRHRHVRHEPDRSRRPRRAQPAREEDAHASGRPVRLHGPARAVRQCLDLVGLDRYVV